MGIGGLIVENRFELKKQSNENHCNHLFNVQKKTQYILYCLRLFV